MVRYVINILSSNKLFICQKSCYVAFSFFKEVYWLTNIHVWQEKYNFKRVLNEDEVVGRFLWSVGHSSGLHQMVGYSGPPLCRGMSCAQCDGNPVVLLVLDSKCLQAVSPSLSCILHALMAHHILIVCSDSCILDLRVKKKVLLDSHFVTLKHSLRVNCFSELLLIREIIFTRHLLLWIKRLSWLMY